MPPKEEGRDPFRNAIIIGDYETLHEGLQIKVETTNIFDIPSNSKRMNGKEYFTIIELFRGFKRSLRAGGTLFAPN